MTYARKTLATIAALMLAAGAVGCSSTGKGAALGGVAGHVLSGGDTGATLGGAAAGAYIGHERDENKK
jgi:osmotically inducible lipoprotein OsmB